MMNEKYWLSRTELLLGREKLEKLKKSHILIAGLGGVGSYAAEAVCRAGVGKITIVDNDVVMASNRNRQLLALISTDGRSKISLMAERLKDINPDLELIVSEAYLKDESIPELLNHSYDYVIDAIDTLSPKIFFIKNCVEQNLPLVSSMGSGGRVDPSKIEVADISESHTCPFARIVRKKLHGWNIRTGFKVVFSSEPVIEKAVIETDNSPNKKSTVGTISYLPAIFGMTAASVAIRIIIDSET